jgi:formylglycine-generating enzyme required for sulfatase activity
MKGFKDDGYFYTGPVKSFPPGPYGLYDMKGNVAEWTSTARDEILNVEVKPDKLKASFIVKGGGWNSTPFYLQAGVCQFFPVDDAHSFVGFRYVVYVFKK